MPHLIRRAACAHRERRRDKREEEEKGHTNHVYFYRDYSTFAGNFLSLLLSISLPSLEENFHFLLRRPANEARIFLMVFRDYHAFS